MHAELPTYEVRYAGDVPADWPTQLDFWRRALQGKIGSFHPRGSGHRPQVSFNLLWSETDLYLHFDVADESLLCANTQRQSPVYQDSCVEFFVMPAQQGHLNFETSANGTMLASHVRDPKRTTTGFVDYSMLSDKEMDQIEIHSRVHGTVAPERHEPVNWWISLRIPLAVLRLAGAQTLQRGITWRGNFYKCADNSARRHYGSWSPVGEKLDFHQPSRFGVLRFVR